MSKQNPKFTNSGRARTFSDKHPYLKPQFWANPASWFWEDETHTPKAKEYFRAKIATLLSDPHNQVRIQNSQEL